MSSDLRRLANAIADKVDNTDLTATKIDQVVNAGDNCPRGLWKRGSIYYANIRGPNGPIRKRLSGNKTIALKMLEKIKTDCDINRFDPKLVASDYFRRRANGEGSVFQRNDGRWTAVLTIGYSAFGSRIRKTVYADANLR